MEDEIGMILFGNLEREKPWWTQPIIQYPDLEAMYSFVHTKSRTNTCLAAATSMDVLMLKKLVNKQRRRSQATNPEAVGSRLRERERKQCKSTAGNPGFANGYPRASRSVSQTTRR
jgi:hypothetical protein